MFDPVEIEHENYYRAPLKEFEEAEEIEQPAPALMKPFNNEGILGNVLKDIHGQFEFVDLQHEDSNAKFESLVNSLVRKEFARLQRSFEASIFNTLEGLIDATVSKKVKAALAAHQCKCRCQRDGHRQPVPQAV